MSFLSFIAAGPVWSYATQTITPEHGTLPPGLASNHEKPMRGVAAELFDQAEFPIEIGLHRRGRDLDALIGPPITVRGIGFWRDHRRPDFERAVIAAVEHIGLPAHLREPGCGHVGADAEIV